MSERVDLTWPEGNGHPFRVLDAELLTYFDPVLDADGKQIGSKPWSFTIASARPASAAEVEQRRDQRP